MFSADRTNFGNAQYWGALGSVAAAALASKRIVVSCEEIVEHDIIQSSPHLTLIPAYRVDAVVEVPWGANPTEVLGYYNMDQFMYGLFMMADGTADGLKAWMDEWIYGCENRAAYIDHYIQKIRQQDPRRYPGQGLLLGAGQLWISLYLALGSGRQGTEYGDDAPGV